MEAYAFCFRLPCYIVSLSVLRPDRSFSLTSLLLLHLGCGVVRLELGYIMFSSMLRRINARPFLDFMLNISPCLLVIVIECARKPC